MALEPPAKLLGALALALGVLVGCSDGQDPGLAPDTGGPRETSDTLGRCPPGGPDVTTPPAGCIDAEGRVQRP